MAAKGPRPYRHFQFNMSLVSFPVSLYATGDDHGVGGGSWMRISDGSPVGLIKYAKEDTPLVEVTTPEGETCFIPSGDERLNEMELDGSERMWYAQCPKEEIVTGTEWEGKTVVLEKADYDKAMPEKNGLINVDITVDADAVSLMAFSGTYYLAPGSGGEKAYSLIYEALRKSGKVGVTQYVLTKREELAIIRPENGVLVLQQLAYPDEIRDPTALEVEPVQATDKESEMAIALIEALADEWKPEQYEDHYASGLAKVIEAKAAGTELPAPIEFKPVAVPDVMAALAASLKQAKSKKKVA